MKDGAAAMPLRHLLPARSPRSIHNRSMLFHTPIDVMAVVRAGGHIALLFIARRYEGQRFERGAKGNRAFIVAALSWRVSRLHGAQRASKDFSFWFCGNKTLFKRKGLRHLLCQCVRFCRRPAIFKSAASVTQRE